MAKYLRIVGSRSWIGPSVSVKNSFRYTYIEVYKFFMFDIESTSRMSSATDVCTLIQLHGHLINLQMRLVSRVDTECHLNVPSRDHLPRLSR